MEGNLIELKTYKDQKSAEVARVKLQKAGIIGLIVTNEEEESAGGKVSLLVKPADHARAKLALSEDLNTDLSGDISESEKLLNSPGSNKAADLLQNIVNKFKAK